ncbi:MAG: TIR domain-containing protein [Bacilli bacterium]|nr:TIR domain-containing protein [Bacilli bacterium]
MAIFKCKMCGASIEINNNEATCECEYCGTIQTMPQVQDNNKLISLHNRANTLRLKCDFDKALSTYENIISENEKDAEAHFGLLLCKYGIEYVDDPKTGKKIPTCHRTIAKSIFDDIDYQEAINNSDVVARRIYEEEANRIDLIQKSILSISVNEKPYDIFICYKETDDSGKRTKDSVIAQELYEELVKKGYKVFFSRITLESKLGREYEPYIYAALTSSKVMLVIGSKIEYFNAVWVKNEWSRFLGFMENDKNKYIIPCYKDLDAYDLPDELLSFQSQDMSKLGFMQDLLRGIDKLISRENQSVNVIDKQIVQKSNYTVNTYNVNALFVRADILLQDSDYDKASGVIEEILKMDPENAKAYIYLTLIDLGLKKEDDLLKCRAKVLDNKNFKWATRFATGDYENTIQKYIDKIKDNTKNGKTYDIYDHALDLMKDGRYTESINLFKSIINFEDSAERIEECIGLLEEQKYKNAVKLKDSGYFIEALQTLNEMKQSDAVKWLIDECKHKYYDKEYQHALDLINMSFYNEALEILYYMNGVGDVNEKIRFCDEAIKKSKYNSAISSKNNKAYQRAIDVFTSIIDYRDSKEQIEECKNLSKYQNAMELKAAKYYVQARKKFEEIKDFKDSLDQIEYCNRGLIIESKKSKIIKIVIGIVASLLIIVPLVIWLISFA